ncbi:MAG: hypothetical protein M1816_005221 [Peltula sp. TS41687]|nr:MAG: hypothetical protein M1816_005221 [Peltula sp. TS41687]
MHGLYFLYPFLALSGATAAAAAATNSVLLSNVKTLTLRNGLKTSHRRVSAIPQLKCVGGTAKGLYEVDVMRCKNQGSDYDDENIQWTCTASLPPEFKLGSTEVICEGYGSPTDPKILKGSCGVEYRLSLTPAGEEKYGGGGGGHGGDHLWSGFKRKGQIDWSATIFWVLFVGVLGWMIYSALVNRRRGAAGPLTGGGGQPWGGGGGGGGGRGDDDPPPPYDYRPSQRKQQQQQQQRQGQRQEGWRPGFWTGALGGAAAGYLAGGGNRGRDYTPPAQQQGRNNGWWGGGNAAGEGSSRWGGGGGGGGGRRDGSSSTSSSASSSRYESTGFGSTSRR